MSVLGPAGGKGCSEGRQGAYCKHAPSPPLESRLSYTGGHDNLNTENAYFDENSYRM